MKKLLYIVIVIVIASCAKDPILYTLTTSVNPTEGGTLSPVTTQFEEGETVVLNAIPSAEYNFFAWSGVSGSSASASIVMDSDKAVTAVFTKKRYALNILIFHNGLLIAIIATHTFQNTINVLFPLISLF